MTKKDFSKRILVGITGYRDRDWKSKIKEIDKFKLAKVSLFLERFKKGQRKEIYSGLLDSKIKKIPLVHIRHDMDKEELKFLAENFGSKYFTIHEDGFRIMERWKGFYKDLYLEMNYDGFVPDSVEVARIGGFCIDLSHFKAAAAKWSDDFDYVFERRKTSHYFDCNHLNGYDPKKKIDMHVVKSLKDFEYLKTLPKFLFGDIIGIEVDNSIADQLRFKKYLVKLLNKMFKI